MKKLNITIEGTYCDGEEFIKTVKDPVLVPNIIKEINETDNNKCKSIEKNKTELLELISKFKDELLEYTELTTIDFELKFVEEEGMFTDKKELIIYMSCDKGKYYVGCMDELDEIITKYKHLFSKVGCELESESESIMYMIYIRGPKYISNIIFEID